MSPPLDAPLQVCIFAYGQTGSGKTFTMQGAEERETWGLIPRALTKILEVSDSMRADGWTWSLSASFLEIYNENLRDLLHDPKKDGAAPSYAMRPDPAWGIVVANMSKVDVSSMEQITSLMAKASKQRTVGCTDMNAQSSRSHSVFALYLKGTNEKLGTELHGALHLVDLAGSEVRPSPQPCPGAWPWLHCCSTPPKCTAPHLCAFECSDLTARRQVGGGGGGSQGDGGNQRLPLLLAACLRGKGPGREPRAIPGLDAHQAHGAVPLGTRQDADDGQRRPRGNARARVARVAQVCTPGQPVRHGRRQRRIQAQAEHCTHRAVAGRPREQTSAPGDRRRGAQAQVRRETGCGGGGARTAGGGGTGLRHAAGNGQGRHMVYYGVCDTRGGEHESSGVAARACGKRAHAAPRHAPRACLRERRESVRPRCKDT